MSPRSAAAPQRRTQEERSAATRGALLDAAVACLIEDGYANLTTTTVADRAGVSRGAQLHHFPTRAELVAAAVAHVFRGLTDAYESAFASLGPTERNPAHAARLLWGVYVDPRHQGVLDLYTAARTDAELRESLLPVARRHRDNVLALARRYFPASAGKRQFELTLELLLHAMLGMTVARCLYGDEGIDPELPAFLEELAARAERPALQAVRRREPAPSDGRRSDEGKD